MTSFDRPVVPEVGMSTARSSGPTDPSNGNSAAALSIGPVAEQVVEVEHLESELSACLVDEGPQGCVGDDQPGEDLADETGELVRRCRWGRWRR